MSARVIHGDIPMSSEINEIHRLLAPFLVTGLAGTELTPAERELLSLAPPAGVILFQRNVESIEQLCNLTHDIKAIVETASGLPPLIMADHEGGRISVLAGAIGAPPSQMAAWKPRSEKLLSGIVSCTVLKMKRCGVNLTLSPVADVASEPLNPVIGTRSFGEDPETVSDAVRIAVRAIAGEGMLSCLKHFPGHGATVLDSHLALPVAGRSIGQLREVELPPFIAGIGEGADMVMTAHIAMIDGDPPASLDREIVTGLLREELGFDGVVITDALEMAGALPDGIAMRSIDPAGGGKAGDTVPAAVTARALEAGNDLLLMSRPVGEVYAELELHEGDLAEALAGAALAGLMEESAARIAAIRRKASVCSAGTMVDQAANGRCDESLLMKKILFPDEADGPALPVFLGAKTDFDSYVVRRFISRVLEGLDRPDSVPERHIDPEALIPVRTGDGEETGLYLFEPIRRPAVGRSLIMLCRKPPPGKVVRTVASGYDSVVVAGRPWDAALLPSDSSVAVTYGVYDAAADYIAKIIRGRV